MNFHATEVVRTFKLPRGMQIKALEEFHSSTSPAHQHGAGLQSSDSVGKRLNPRDQLKISAEARAASEVLRQQQSTTVEPVDQTAPKQKLPNKDGN